MQLHKIYGEQAGGGAAINLREAPSEGNRVEPSARREVVFFLSWIMDWFSRHCRQEERERGRQEKVAWVWNNGLTCEGETMTRERRRGRSGRGCFGSEAVQLLQTRPLCRKDQQKKFAALSLTRTRMHARTSTHMILNTVPPCWQPLLVFQASCALRPALESRFRSIQAAELHAFLNWGFKQMLVVAEIGRAHRRQWKLANCVLTMSKSSPTAWSEIWAACGRTEKALKCYVQRMNSNSLMQSHRQCFTATQLRRQFILLTWLGIFYKWTAHRDNLSVKELLPNIGGGKSNFFRHPMHLSYVHYAHSKFLLGLQVQFVFFAQSSTLHIPPSARAPIPSGWKVHASARQWALTHMARATIYYCYIFLTVNKTK